MIRLGPFQIVYTSREQKVRDTIAHLVHKHGLLKARLLVNEEYNRHWMNPTSEPAIYWNDVRWEIKHLTHLSGWAAEKGL